MTGDRWAGYEPCGLPSASGTTRRKCLAHGRARQTWSTDGLDRGDYPEVPSRPSEVLCGGHRGQPVRTRRNGQIRLCNNQLSGRHPRHVARFRLAYVPSVEGLETLTAADTDVDGGVDE